MPHEYDLAALSHGRLILADAKGFVLAKEQLLNELAVEIVTQPSTEHVVPEWIANAVDAKLTTVSDADNMSLATMVDSGMWLPDFATVWSRVRELAPVAISVSQEVRRQTAFVAARSVRSAACCFRRVVVGHTQWSIQRTSHGAVRRRRHRHARRRLPVALGEDDDGGHRGRSNRHTRARDGTAGCDQALRLRSRGGCGRRYRDRSQLLQVPRCVAGPTPPV